MAGASNWDFGWDHRSRRYYYQDRVTGKSTWETPPGCTLKLPDRPPEDVSVGPIPEDLPHGWMAVWDLKSKRYYYVNTTKGQERTWFKPPMIQSEMMNRTANDLANIPETKAKQSRADMLRNVVWDADSCKHLLEDSALGKSSSTLPKIMRDVYLSNMTILQDFYSHERLPVTVPSTYEDCMLALMNRKVVDFGKDPLVTMSKRSLCDVVLSLAKKDPSRVICAISDADGVEPGSGYTFGGLGTEENMCRRIPKLYESLSAANENGLYPFGPSTCNSAEKRNKYCDVLFTPRLTIVRGHQDQGFPILKESDQAKLGLISSSAPDASRSEITDDAQLLSGLVTSMLVTPVMREPKCTTLVIGPWGVEAGNDARRMADLFAKAIVGEIQGVGVRMGRLYSQIYFAIPPPKTPADENVAEIWRAVLAHPALGLTVLDA
mmetsp:Transcript_29174/g.63441  ORF Transcript_29174/g.63441 Transcript_29174/m.63441 type:complete len:435 (+) Transcript_29174:70-1374(+)